MIAIQICALISIVIATGILYWIGYRGGLTDGEKNGYSEGYSHGYVSGRDEASAAFAASIKEMSDQRMRTELLLSREPQDRYTLLAIAEKLKLAADTFRAVKSESQATQALALRDKALDMAALMDNLELKEDAA
ncbi:hypothetical protein A7318_15775 [Pseudomonas lurida]|uniref:hypothetical protein n=1 Tax=Pseudomonas lurida TaxID=244566 RepID=UPI00083D8BFD|nr:hypothetical protein [Pseudomonas lurida]AOE80000.1 hypothetical protein A7318_15775 [Pseudomonas lurida]